MSVDPSYVKSVDDLLRGIENGEYAIPLFQRKFEWQPQMVSELIVSILQDYYTGLLLFWELPDEFSMGEWDPICGAIKPEKPSIMVLDGQQRLSSLYYAIYSPEKKFPNRNTYYRFFIDIARYLEGDYEEAVYYEYSRRYMSLQEIKDRKETWIENNRFPLSLLQDRKFLNSEFNEWLTSYTKNFVDPEEIESFLETRDKIAKIRNILDYGFITHTLGKERELPDICEIFARINQKGMRLSTFDLMNAFLFPRGIHLREIWEQNDRLEIKRIHPKMGEYLLKTVSLYKQDYCSSKYIYYLVPGHQIKKRDEQKKVAIVKDKEEFMELWNKSYRYTAKAVERIKNTGKNDFGAIKDIFIPNTTMIPVMAAILWTYDELGTNKISERKFNETLSRWFWSAVVLESYSGSSDSIMSEDYRDFKKWFDKKDESVIRRIRNISPERIDKLDFRNIKMGSALYKGIMCLLALNGVRDFFTGRTIDTGTYRAEKVHDHHIFPKNIKNLPESSLFKSTRDCILNKTLILDETNEKINHRRPSEYLRKIDLDESQVKEVMNTHFISERARQYLLNDDYDNFILERERTIKERLKELLGL